MSEKLGLSIASYQSLPAYQRSSQQYYCWYGHFFY